MDSKYSFKNDLIKSIEIAQKTGGKYTYIYSPLFKEGIKIYPNQYSIDWILQYKKSRLNDFLNQKKILKTNIEDNLFFYIYYFYAFIIHDIWHLHTYIPKKITNILNLGAGIGLFEIYLHHINKQINKFYIIEKNDLDHNNQVIDVLNMAKKTIQANQLQNKFLFYNDKNYISINEEFDLVLSFRSWCYKYDIDVYLDFILKSISKKTVIIVDIRKKYNESSILERFNDSILITKYPDHNRYLLKNFKG